MIGKATGALLGTGAIAIVFVAYLATQGREEVRAAVEVQSRAIDAELVRDEAKFDARWAEAHGRALSQAEAQAAADRSARAQTLLDEAEKIRKGAAAHSAADLEEMRMELDKMDRR